MPASTIAVIGLGLMGSRMARRLLDHGYAVRAYDPDPDRMAELVEIGGSEAGSPAQAVAGMSLALLSLPNSEVSKEAYSWLRQNGKDPRLIVEHGEQLGAPSDLVEVVADALAEGESTGLADLDNSAIVEVVRRRAGIGRVP